MAKTVRPDRNKFSWPSIIYCLLGGGPVVSGGVGQLPVNIREGPHFKSA